MEVCEETLLLDAHNDMSKITKFTMKKMYSSLEKVVININSLQGNKELFRFCMASYPA